MEESFYIPYPLNEEVDKVSTIIEQISTNGESYFIDIFKEIKKSQPFLLHTFLNFSNKISNDQLNFLTNDLVIIWLYFREEPNAKEIKISVEDYLYFYRKNLEIIEEVSNQLIDSSSELMVDFGQKDCKSQALISMIGFRFHALKEMKSLSPEFQAEILLTIKSMVQSFEKIIRIEP
ncbi:MAG: hypothetical protein CFE21_07405 [Bacteroidetes bacterium B1(2017)]|nr:MAG: hypothetical protein CFE21_07405 [Bacteroidetes bacterium B1(2017)]